MPSSVHDFRRLTRKDITLPSGLTVSIRKVPAIEFLVLGDVPLPRATPGEPGTQEVRDILPFYDLLVTRGCVVPPMLPRGHADTLDGVRLDDLDFDDYQALALDIAHWSGLSAEVAQQAQAFCGDPAGEAPETDGGALRDTAITAS